MADGYHGNRYNPQSLSWWINVGHPMPTDLGLVEVQSFVHGDDLRMVYGIG